MGVNEYPSNSNVSKKASRDNIPEKKIEKVATGKAKKKSEIRKFTDVFISEDINSVKSYILLDVVVPAVKKAISDVVTNGIDMLLYGETGHSSKKNTASKVSYQSYFNSRDDRRDSRPTRSSYGFDEIALETRGEAEEVLTRMEELIEMYGVVSVADLYDLVDITSKYTDHKYGWTDIRNASIVRIRDGYLIKLPKPMPID